MTASQPTRKLVFLLGVLLLSVPFRLQADSDDGFGGSNIGERLFLETRFAEFFFANSGGDTSPTNANVELTNGDPVMDFSVSPSYGNLPGPFAGLSMNCRACHLVEEQEATANRTYCDFAARSPIPNIGDGRTTTPRNAMPLVDALLPRPTPLLLHNDGQFASARDLIIGTLTGRNYGWQPTQYATAIHHIASIIRNDDGAGSLAKQYGGWSYSVAFEGLGEIQSQYLIPSSNRMDVTITDTTSPDYVTDDQIVGNIASLIQEYLGTLVFSQDANGNFNGSPFDAFLILNGLPQQPGPNETSLQYARRLLRLVAGLSSPQWVTDPADGHFITNAKGQQFQFGSNELAGLEIFLSDSSNLAVATNLQQQGITTNIEVGNCLACHTPPAFTDFLFHNTGAAQAEYDGIFSNGAFMSLSIPSLTERQSNYNAYLPPTTNHPYATGSYELPPMPGVPGQVDLGLWNVFANPDFPAPQPALQQILPRLLSVPSPQLAGIGASNNNFYFNVLNATPGWTYDVLVSTNLGLPIADWTPISTRFFVGYGQTSFTNAITPGRAQQFYAVALRSIPTEAALPQTIALFKTPTVRDLVGSDPYMHTGQMDTIGDVLQLYIKFSAMARAGLVRNAAPQLSAVSIDQSAVAPLTAFLIALNEEDYADIPCPCAPQPPPPPH